MEGASNELLEIYNSCCREDLWIVVQRPSEALKLYNVEQQRWRALNIKYPIRKPHPVYPLSRSCFSLVAGARGFLWFIEDDLSQYWLCACNPLMGTWTRILLRTGYPPAVYASGSTVLVFDARTPRVFNYDTEEGIKEMKPGLDLDDDCPFSDLPVYDGKDSWKILNCELPKEMEFDSMPWKHFYCKGRGVYIVGHVRQAYLRLQKRRAKTEPNQFERVCNGFWEAIENEDSEESDCDWYYGDENVDDFEDSDDQKKFTNIGVWKMNVAQDGYAWELESIKNVADMVKRARNARFVYCSDGCENIWALQGTDMLKYNVASKLWTISPGYNTYTYDSDSSDSCEDKVPWPCSDDPDAASAFCCTLNFKVIAALRTQEHVDDLDSSPLNFNDWQIKFGYKLDTKAMQQCKPAPELEQQHVRVDNSDCCFITSTSVTEDRARFKLNSNSKPVVVDPDKTWTRKNAKRPMYRHGIEPEASVFYDKIPDGAVAQALTPQKPCYEKEIEVRKRRAEVNDLFDVERLKKRKERVVNEGFTKSSSAVLPPSTIPPRQNEYSWSRVIPSPGPLNQKTSGVYYNATTSRTGMRMPCKFYQMGYCRHGNKCRFQHA